ncbi:MAG: hypothetical protein QXU32_04915 [Nitrososphaerales archaeon]
MQRILSILPLIGIVPFVAIGYAQTITHSMDTGDVFLQSPIDTASVGFKLETVLRGDYFVNLISACIFQSDNGSITPNETLLEAGSLIICKLTDDSNGPDQFGNVIAEGHVYLEKSYEEGETVEIPITQFKFLNSNEVQNVHDVKIIVMGPPVGLEQNGDKEEVAVNFGIDFETNTISICIVEINRDLPMNTTVVCMLSDKDGNFIAQGSVTIDEDTESFTPIRIEIHGDNDVQKIHDVRIIIRKAEGCTPGFWKQPQHFDSWVGFAPTDRFEAVFGRDVAGDPTLLEAMELQGGGLNALIRHAVAALLSASSPDVNVGDPDIDTVAEVVAAFQAAFDSGIYEPMKNKFEASNEAGCPLS